MRIIVAEKPIAAERIAKILGLKEKKMRGKWPYFILENGDVIIPLKGHILDVDFPQELNNWGKTDLFDLLKTPLIYREQYADVVQLLRDFGKKADELIIATDYDREGESIGKEAISIVKLANPKIKVKRAKFSAITEKDIKNAFNHLQEFNGKLADAADARREIDLIWGAVLTRYISLTSGRRGKDFLSVGRVQTPTLALMVEREKEILSFKPRKYYVVKIRGKIEGEYPKTFEKREDAEKIPKEGLVKVIAVEKKIKQQKPPIPFNTTEFLKEAAQLGYKPSRAMKIAESLYMKGFISYPRTDNTAYPKNLPLKEILQKLRTVPKFKKFVDTILSGQIKPTRGKETKDHPPIHPVDIPKNVSKDEQKIWELIAARFLATLSKPAKYESIKVNMDYAGFNFVAKGQRLIEKGWRAVYPYQKWEEKPIDVEKGESWSAKRVIEEKKTKPRGRFSWASIIKEMEALNLGTKATRPEILQKLLNRKYIMSKRNLQPSPVAFAVIEALQKYAPIITKPEMTAKIEREMDLIEKGEKEKRDVVLESREQLKSILQELMDKKKDIGKELRKALRGLQIIGPCPKCGGMLRVVLSKDGRRFIGCSNFPECKVSYSIPQKGRVNVEWDVGKYKIKIGKWEMEIGVGDEN